MLKYTVTYDDGATQESGELLAPERLPQAGDVYEFIGSVYTLGSNYCKGERVEVIERTTSAPHHRRSSLGNLLIKCKSYASVWTNFDTLVALGEVKLIETKPIAN